MDQSTLVVDQISDGRRFVERFAADGNSVCAAFWVKTTEEGLWFLYVTTTLVDDVGPAVSYRAVHSALNRLPDRSISSSEIKVISPRNPLAKDVLAIMNHRPFRSGMRLGRQTIGSMEVDQLYIYPPAVFVFTQANPMTTEDVSREVVRLMSRDPGVPQPSRVTLKDGAQFNGIPFALEVGPQNSMIVRFIADGEAAPRVIRLDEIASIA